MSGVALRTAAELRKQVPRPDPDWFNSGLVCPTSDWMVEMFGIPGRLTTDCSPVTNKRLLALIVTESVGPFRVTGLKPAVAGLRHVFEDVMTAGRRDLYNYVETDGMLCCRALRGTHHYSNHSFGTAVDLDYGPGEEMGDGTVQQGLLDLYPFFHKRQWYAGLGYHGREDAMHFEASEELIQTWERLGMLPGF